MACAKLLLVLLFIHGSISQKDKRALQKSHEKPQEEKWMDTIFNRRYHFESIPSLVRLLKMISEKYFGTCVPVVLYDEETQEGPLLLEYLFKDYPIPFVHGQIKKDYTIKQSNLLNSLDKCVSYILIMHDVMKCKNVIGAQNVNKVVVVSRSSQWRVYEFLASEAAQSFVNLLVIAQSEKSVIHSQGPSYILYTHNLYVDGLGSSTPQVLTSWINGNLTRPHVELFPPKMKKGFAGHRFIIALANQPPFAIKRGLDDNDDLVWEGVEVRLIQMLGEIYNFTTDFREAKDADTLGSNEAVTQEIINGKADLGLGGLYVVPERISRVDVSYGYAQDCAAFVSLTSTALPRWRAIMGPFQWTVWMTLTLTYLFAIFPLSFSDRHTLKYLLDNPEEMENMFWYVFGTFTNCFSFSSNKSWSKSDKVTTRLLIGFYWIFTIITTACYTGSIIAFVTLPVFPETLDTVKQLLDRRYQIGTLDRDGWQYWFDNSTDPITKRLLKNVEYVSTVQAGIKNTTTAFFWSYAFLGSKAQLDYIIRANFTTSKRTLLHISSECFVPFGVSMIFQENSLYKAVLNEGLIRALESGFMIKFKNDVEWVMMRSATGKLLQANSGSSTKFLNAEDRALALDDTQGMFILMGFGYLLGGAALFSEVVGGCFNFCKRRGWGSRASACSIDSHPRSYDVPTPRQKLDSIQYSKGSRLLGSFDEAIKEREDEEEASPKKQESIEEVQVDVEAEIDKIFNFEELFGEENGVETGPAEDLREECNTKETEYGWNM